jgi:hypothetical protein
VGQINEEGRDFWHNGRIVLEGRCLEIMEKVKKDKEVREGLRDYKAAAKDVMALKKEFIKRVKEFKTGLRAEMGVDEKVKAVMKAKGSVLRLFTRKAKNEGSLIAGAFNIVPAHRVEKFLLGAARFFRWRMHHVFN